jgi:hypothetical protein
VTGTPNAVTLLRSVAASPSVIRRVWHRAVGCRPSTVTSTTPPHIRSPDSPTPTTPPPSADTITAFAIKQDGLTSISPTVTFSGPAPSAPPTPLRAVAPDRTRTRRSRDSGCALCPSRPRNGSNSVREQRGGARSPFEFCGESPRPEKRGGFANRLCEQKVVTKSRIRHHLNDRHSEPTDIDPSYEPAAASA